MTHEVTSLRVFSCVMLGLLLGGVVQAQDGSVHGTVQSVCGETVIVKMKEGYEVAPGTKGTIYHPNSRSGDQSGARPEIHVKEVGTSTVIARVLQSRAPEAGRAVRFADVRTVATDTIDDSDGRGAVYDVDEAPRVKGGYGSLVARMEYPKRARRTCVEGVVCVRVLVDTSGDVEEARIIQSLGAGADKEVLRVIGSTTFIPAKRKGEDVSAWEVIKIEFKQQG